MFPDFLVEVRRIKRAVVVMSEKKGQVQDLRDSTMLLGRGWKGNGEGLGRWRRKALLEKDDSGRIPDFQLEDLRQWQHC